jgi:hypothetical protein
MKSVLFVAIFIGLLSSMSYAASVEDCMSVAKTAGMVMQQRHTMSKEDMKALMSAGLAKQSHTMAETDSMNRLVDRVYKFPKKSNDLDIAEDITTISILIFSSCINSE